MTKPHGLEADKNEKSNDKKVAENVANLIREKIMDGLLSPGQRLIESELMKEFGIGRSTIRETYLKLEAKGLVELRHQRGAIVKKMTKRDMAELFAIRQQLEGMAAALAAENIDKGQNRQWLMQAREIWSQDYVLSNELRHMEENVPFHEGIIGMAGNHLLAKMLQPLQIPGYRMQYLRLMTRDYCEKSSDDHIKIADAILAGDSETAEKLMQDHVKSAADLAQRIPGLE
uniref:Transcriptional regulator n=1 Tax=carbazole-degrading bacterium OC11S TaxID=512998 RepID=C4B8G0_UNCXX|nr:transcriptional regulator [carbazole-degrading bacterium OC11S]